MSSPTQTFGFLLVWFSYQVSAANFRQSSPLIVSESSEVEITCSHDDSSLILMLWYQNKKDTNSMTLIGYGYENSQSYEGEFEKEYKLTRKNTVEGALRILKADPSHSAVYFCAASIPRGSGNPAYFGQGTKLTVLEPGVNITEPTVKILRPSPHECRDQKNEKGKRRKTLVCVASGFYPDHVSVFWQFNGLNITDGVATDANATKNETSGLYSITSRLRMDAENWLKLGNEFSCHVIFFNGKDYADYTESIYTNETDKGMTREKYLKITQNAKLSFSALILKSCLYAALVCFLVWKLQSSPRNQKK